MLVGAKPRTKGMERADLLKDNGKIFVELGQAMDQVAHPDMKAIVVGNPANTNALILASQLKRLRKEQVTCMLRLDHNRALSQLMLRLNCSVFDIQKIAVFGNHSPTMYPYLNAGTVKGKPLLQAINDEAWVRGEFNETVQKRGAEIIKWRGASSAASAASAAIDHIHDWELGNDDWVTVGMHSQGNT